MSKLKKLIIKIFNIKPKDLDTPVQNADNSIPPIIVEEIKKQISSQIRELFGDLNIDALKQLLKDIENGESVGKDWKNWTNQEEEIINEPKFEHQKNAIIEEIPAFKENAQTKISQNHSKISVPVEKDKIRLGIDFGTSTTEISFQVNNKPPEVLPIGTGDNPFLMPSVVYIKPGDGEWRNRVVVGEEAESYGDPERTIRSIKRFLGCDGVQCKNGQFSPGSRCNKEGKVIIDGEKPIDREDIVFIILQEVLNRAIQTIKSKYNIELTKEDVELIPVNIGCGARFNEKQRKLLLSVAHKVGMESVRIRNIIEEPVLSSYTFARFEKEPVGNVLVYDFGGGTFDVAIVSIDENKQITVLATDGESWLGGDDIDSLIFDYLLESISKNLNLPVERLNRKLDPITLGGLKQTAKKYKEELSFYERITDNLLLPEFGNFSFEISRETFEQLLDSSNIIQKSLECTERACRLMYAYYHTKDQAKNGKLPNASNIISFNLKMANEYIDRVVLIGGITKIPYVKKQLSKYFDEKKFSDQKIIEPILAVAIGGAYSHHEQNYSICFPPYELYIESSDYMQRKSVILPYDYLNFHKDYQATSRPVYKVAVNIEQEMKAPKLILRKVDQIQPEWSYPLPTFPPGGVNFYLTIEGEIFYQSAQGKNLVPIRDKFLPTHPLQDEIRKAKNDYNKRKQNNEKSRRGDFEDWYKDMMNEK
ncbi:Hsp70 family protein [Bellilinea sp.]|uniref:Hsp70 family protein n=1 Tax=Bellilinea sp. TaxID=2838785 RepID=UPI002ADD513F|nr:Hsp70 family protein [Bellilinea sp.]